MKYAIVHGEKIEAYKGAKGVCQICGSELIAKCGEIKVNHWAHKGNRNCDPWWENETEWHRAWKGKFPKEWQEVIHIDQNGEKHIADVITNGGWVIEFQHSYLKPEERRTRNAFYPKLIWVVNGLRRPTDLTQFNKLIEESTVMCEKPFVVRVRSKECRPLKEWDNNNSLVFFDFQEVNSTKQLLLWFLYPKVSTNDIYMSVLSRNYLIELLSNDKFEELFKNTVIRNRKELEKAYKFKVRCKAIGGT